MAIVQTGQGHLAELSTLEPSDRPGKGYGRKKRELGLKWVETFQAYADLKPDEAVLDVGCGPGRMALALAAYLGRRVGMRVSTSTPPTTGARARSNRGGRTAASS